MFDAFFQGGDLAEPGAVLRLDKTFLGRCPENVRYRDGVCRNRAAIEVSSNPPSQRDS